VGGFQQFGSTFSSIFEGIEGLEFANVYCASGRPDNGIVGRYFQITEQSLLRNLVNRAVPSGHAFRDSDASNTGAATSGVLEARALLPWYEFAKTKRWQPFLWIRDLGLGFGSMGLSRIGCVYRRIRSRPSFPAYLLLWLFE